MTQEGGGASRSTDSVAGTSQATDVSLREYLTAQINESRRECRENIKHLERHFDEIQRHNESRRAEEMADITRRFDGVNEFRASLSDLSALMATKDNMSRVEEKFSAQTGAQNARLSALERRMDLREGQHEGSRLTLGNLIALVTVGVGILGAIIVLANYLSGQ
jgi:hypothetical protein